MNHHVRPAARQPGGADLPQGHPRLAEGGQDAGQHVERRDHEQQDQGVARRRPARRSSRGGEDQEAEEGEEGEAEERRGPPVAVVEQRVLSDADKVGRNDPCPCGSGKKYKRCHGA